MSAALAASYSRLPPARDNKHGGLRVLLIEDSPSDALALSENLRDIPELQPDILHASTLADALVWVRDNRFDIVFADLNLPDSAGVETFKWLRASAPDQPIIVLTGDQRPEIVHELFELGAEDCLVKSEYVGWMLLRSIRLARERHRVAVELHTRTEELRRSEYRIREIIEVSTAAFLVVDGSGTVKYANQAAATMLRRSSNKVVGMPFGLPTDPGTVAEVDVARKDGSMGVAELQVVEAQWDGKPAMLISLHDITERKRVEEELASTNVRLRSALEGGGGIGTWVLHVTRDYICWDAAVSKLLGKAGKEHTGADVGTMLRFVHREDRTHVAKARESAVQGSGDIDIEFRLALKDGKIRWFSVKGHAECFTDGKPLRITGACIDITERKLAEESQMRGQKLEALGTLAGGIAHDFNNILLAINSSAALALEDARGSAVNSDTLRQRIEVIQKAGTRAAALVRQILAFSRKGEVSHDPISLDANLHEAYSMLRSTMPAMIDIRLRIAENLPAVAVDPTHFHQIVINLVTNASHAIGGDRGGNIDIELDGVDIVASQRSSSSTERTEIQPGSYVRLSIADTGIGMDQRTLERIFDPFFTTKPVGQGTGLGLSVVHGIMRALGGGIDVSSTVGVGTRFDLYFPACEQRAVGESAAVDDVPRGSGQKILYVDDDEILANLCVEVLREMGYEVVAHCAVDQAIADFEARPCYFDAVVTDLSMPGMSGLEFSRKVLTIRADVPVLITSGYVREEDQRIASEIGVREIVLKPKSFNELGAALFRVLNTLR